MTAFPDLIAFQRDTEALAQVMGRLGWDQETMMPRGAAEQRADEMAALEGVLHARRTDPRLADWLDRADAPDAEGARMLALIRRAHARATCIPARLAAEIARLTSLSQGIWAEARARDEVDHFLPTLRQVVMLKREAAQALCEGTEAATAYDALLEEYEPETTAEEIAAIFDRMRPRLVALRDRILGSGRIVAPLKGEFPQDGQLRLARKMAEAFGYDFTRGRLDLAVHPFSSGSGADVRITTRVVEADPFNCLYSTIHETGHACYEQNIAPAFALTVLGQGVSMGVHESQSRIYENQLGRSAPFTGWIFRQMQAEFGSFGIETPEEFHATVNRVQPGFIRTEADEVHYNLHIMMRFDLERDLVSGALDVADLEEAWNDRFLADFGVAVDRPAHGLLQDVHWSVGLFGYFPTYSLGNVYAGCLMAALRRDVPDLDARLARGDTAAATGWLRERLQQHGGLYAPREVIARATGAAPDEGPLLDYLDAKFGAIYGL
ncbi:carboxypeptidase M32 [Frigidibacter oleivorans]|uniref:carboxypeptidase M32 n=1 Tax=Frigidibacter oleivorans TaxID=2487129 RepID=UPI000F8EC18A|nr:carboxypeptidase M32 [Frigidibacter oleivorans]